MSERYRLLHDAHGNKAGTVVYRYLGHDYGLCEDDHAATGVEHQAVTLKAGGYHPFFTVPANHLEPA